MEWIYFVFMFLNGLFCYYIGCRVTAAENEKNFQPTQETWLELEKFRWIHPLNSAKVDKEEQ